MKKYLKIATENRLSGTYIRKNFRGDVLYFLYRHRDLNIAFAETDAMVTRVTDSLVDELVEMGLADKETKSAYDKKTTEVFANAADFEEDTVESIYRKVCELRCEFFGSEALDSLESAKMERGFGFDPVEGIDQRAKKNQLLENCEAVIFAFCEAELKAEMLKDMALANKSYLLLGDGLVKVNCDAETISYTSEGMEYNETLQKAIDSGKAALFVYGEVGLLGCRDLLVEAVVHAKPKGYYTQAVTNQLGKDRACVVYIPKNYDITRYVKLTEKTRITYYHIWKLWQAFGDEVYSETLENLWAKHPECFINIYECDLSGPLTPIKLTMPEGVNSSIAFDAERDKAVADYFSKFSGLDYYAAYFDENMQESEICLDSTQKQKGILVHGVKVQRSKGAKVLACGKGGPRAMAEREGLRGPGIASNFLFFLTPRLDLMYNELRQDRPLEQSHAGMGHLDYKLYFDGDKRVETFPLFRKTCIGMTDSGEFLFFNFRLGGGSIDLGGHKISWNQENVDSDEAAPVKIYTPYYSCRDKDANRETYRKVLGEGRVNIVMIQENITCIRQGDVVLPSVGVVLSLDEGVGKKLLEDLKLPMLTDNYYDPKGLSFNVKLDPPIGISQERWNSVTWAYGGGLSLILDGKSFSDDGNAAKWFEDEGWMSPLSRQTQESNLHDLVKHPRTAIGTTEKGELVIFVFSGRTWRSTGADYEEMCAIVRKLVPDIKCLMNVDGGGSAVLGTILDGHFMELSCPSTSLDSCVGMVRPVNTVFYVPLEE